MTDESTDTAVLKQLVFVGRYLMVFLCIMDILNGMAEPIEGAMLKFVGDKALQITRLCIW